MSRVVLVLDVVKGFMEEGNPLYCGSNARRIIPNIQKLLETELSRGSKIFYLCDQHAVDDAEFNMFPPHCIRDTEEIELIEELSSYPGEVIPKTRYSCFWDTVLGEKLEELQPEAVVICGVCTDICVLHTVADARNRGYAVEIPVDCVASFNDKSHLFALEHIEKVLGARLYRISVSSMQEPVLDLPDSILAGDTADIYFVRAVEILKKEGINPVATMEVFASRSGILCGIKEVKLLLERILPETSREVWALSEGESFQKREVVLRITAPYQSYGIYETVYLGILANCSGWATAAKECVESAQGIPVISFGARHVHPLVADRMDYAAIVGGCRGCSSISGAKMAGVQPSGTMPHAFIIIIGDTSEATLMFDKHMPSDVPRIALVDTFKDEPEESINVARALENRLEGVRLDTPSERGGVTVDLVKETRARLDQAGYKDVKILVSGGLSPERISRFINECAPVDYLGVGSYISDSRPIDFTADLHEVEGKPIAKRGRVPGITDNCRLTRIL